MNQAERCHEVAGCTGLYVDGFKAFRSKISNPSSSFILTHYHGDHYNGLPRDGAYVGPALIHCTPVTAALLRSVHGVAPEYIKEHSYGETWKHEATKITFYDANHCPGAAIVLIQLPDGKAHLHTGDMRFHPKMKEYPLLKEAAERRLIDLLYLDTTYSHPKHNFCPQSAAVNSIASQVEQLFEERNIPTLVLLSCYSIGKEKVLWECSKRTNRAVFANERKLKMLRCIQDHKGEEESSSIIDRCTQDEKETDIHVVPMGLCGEMWPYFQPNYNECAKYVGEIKGKRYDRVVAFIPTGWANATNWNKKNAISRRRIDLDKIQKREHGDERTNRRVDVDVRLISYSEHSTFPELCSFVEYLKPRKVIPTVYSDEKDYVAIEARFRDMIDTKRAKQMFVNSMKVAAKKRDAEDKAAAAESKVRRIEDELSSGVSSISSAKPATPKEEDGYDSDIAVIECCDDGANSAVNEGLKAKKRGRNPPCDDKILATLVSMGFEAQLARAALKKSRGNVDRAIESLLTSSKAPTTSTSSSAKSASSSPTRRVDAKKSSASLMRFFSPKKEK